MFAEINGARIFFDVEGKQFVPEGPVMKEKPVCFVVHGGPGCDHGDYCPVLSPLSDYMQLVYIDYRGNGRSERTKKEEYTLDQNVEDIEGLRKYLGLDKIYLLGQSYGGYVGQAYGIRYPENLSGLVLITTACDHSVHEKGIAELEKLGTEEQIQMGKDYLWHGTFPNNEEYDRYYKVFMDLYSYKVRTGEVSREEAEEEIRRGIPSYEAVNQWFGGEQLTFDFREELHTITCPTLVIGGRHDWVAPVSFTYEIADLIPKGKAVVMENSSHSVFTDEPEETLKEIISFILDHEKQREKGV